MGRQIEFVHIEDDMIPFLATIEECGGCIVSADEAKPPLSYSKLMISQMATPVSQWGIVPTNMFSDNIGVISGNVVEFTNCVKGNSLSRVYEVGRLYVLPTPNGGYDPNILKIFDAMRKYMKQNYCYSKSEKIYYSHSFKEQYDRCYYYVAKMGKRILL